MMMSINKCDLNSERRLHVESLPSPFPLARWPWF